MITQLLNNTNIVAHWGRLQDDKYEKWIMTSTCSVNCAVLWRRLSVKFVREIHLPAQYVCEKPDLEFPGDVMILSIDPDKLWTFLDSLKAGVAMFAMRFTPSMWNFFTGLVWAKDELYSCRSRVEENGYPSVLGHFMYIGPDWHSGNRRSWFRLDILFIEWKVSFYCNSKIRPMRYHCGQMSENCWRLNTDAFVVLKDDSRIILISMLRFGVEYQIKELLQSIRLSSWVD